MPVRATLPQRLFGPLVDLLIALPGGEKLLDRTVGSLAGYLKNHRAKRARQALDAAWRPRLLPRNTVLHGPFRGLRYPEEIAASGSRLLPKLLGSYERELHATIEALLQIPFDQIVDIGCAEGYYAVGLALRCPSAQIQARDLDPVALARCQKLAAENGVADRVHTGGTVSPEDFAELAKPPHTLILSDCEGAEKSLFTPNSIPHLAHAYLVIELHDAFDPTISPAIHATFADSHSIEIIPSIPDLHKPRHTSYPEIADLDLPTRIAILDESRPGIMEWAVLSPKTCAP